MRAFLTSFGVIFLAELGDKSQVVAFTLATRYPAGLVLLGIVVTVALLMVVSVAVGGALAAVVPATALGVASGLLFLGFAAWTFLSGDDDESEEGAAPSSGGMWAVLGAFAVSELGDKTMLAAAALAAQGDIIWVWAGATLGMTAADALALVVGRVVGHRISPTAVRIGSAVIFAIFGVWAIVDAVW